MLSGTVIVSACYSKVGTMFLYLQPSMKDKLSYLVYCGYRSDTDYLMLDCMRVLRGTVLYFACSST